MITPAPYLYFPGDAAAAIAFYADAFGADAFAHTFADFGRGDGDAHWIAHGGITGAVCLFCADTSDAVERGNGVQLSILGEDYGLISGWFAALSVGARSVRPLAMQPWGDWDGDLVDRYGVAWLFGIAGEHGAARGQ